MSKTSWPIKTLGDISEIAYGYTESAKSEEVGPKFLRITDIKDRVVNWNDVPYCPIDADQLNRHRLEDGDIVFARTGATTGKSFLVISPPLAVCASYLIRLRIDKKIISPDYLNLNFQTSGYWKQVNDGMSGAAQGGFNATKLGALEIPVPPLEEQRRIVSLLDSATAHVTDLVSFYKQARTHANNLFTSTLSNALGSNSDWPVKTLGEIGSIKGGKRLPKGTLWSSVKTAHPYIRATDIREGEVRTDNLVFVPEEVWPVISRYTVKEGDVLITIAGTIGSVAVVPRELAEANLTENAAKVTNLVDVKPSYLSCFLRSAEVKDRLEGLATTTTQAKLALFRIESIEIPVPPLDEQKRIVERLDLMRGKTSEMVAAYDAKLTAAKNLRQSILEAAFAGEL